MVERADSTSPPSATWAAAAPSPRALIELSWICTLASEPVADTPCDWLPVVVTPLLLMLICPPSAHAPRDWTPEIQTVSLVSSMCPSVPALAPWLPLPEVVIVLATTVVEA